MAAVRIFVYGSLLAPQVVRAVLGRVPRLQPAVLKGYRRCALRGHAFPGLIAAPGAHTAGAVIDVSVRELRRLDRYEDDFYARRAVSVRLDDGTPRNVQTYVLRACHRRLAADREWSVARFMAHEAPRAARRAQAAA